VNAEDRLVIRRQAIVVLMAASVIGLCAAPAGATTPKTPAGFVGWELAQISAHDRAGLWSRLDPLQRAHVARGVYVNCQDKVDPTVKVGSFKIVNTKSDRLTLPGTGRKVDTLAMTLHVRVSDATHDPATAAETIHLIRATDGSFWTGVTAAEFAAYNAGRCPT
jgi:hypothetical protein